MARRTIEVEIDVDEALAAADTTELIRELRRRKDVAAKAAAAAGVEAFPMLNGWDLECLVAAVRDDDGRRCVDLLTPVLVPFHPITRIA